MAAGGCCGSHGLSIRDQAIPAAAVARLRPTAHVLGAGTASSTPGRQIEKKEREKERKRRGEESVDGIHAE